MQKCLLKLWYYFNMARKDKNVTPSVTTVLQNLGYIVADWDDSQSETKITKEVKTVLATASKKENSKACLRRCYEKNTNRRPFR